VHGTTFLEALEVTPEAEDKSYLVIARDYGFQTSRI
jgi:hypothetical protein